MLQKLERFVFLRGGEVKGFVKTLFTPLGDNGVVPAVLEVLAVTKYHGITVSTFFDQYRHV
jgi:hypothetical protein